MTKRCFGACVVFFFVFAGFCVAEPAAEGKKVLYVNSYHAEYPSAIRHMTTLKPLLEEAGVEVRFVHMDTKRNTSEEFKKKAALRVKKIIEEWKPDVVVAADDNASKYLVSKYYRDADLPIVFIGVNWSVDQYGYPYKNVTGQIEIGRIKDLIHSLRLFSHGDKVAILAGEVLTDRKSIGHYKNVPGVKFDQEVYVDNVDDWKARFLELQESADMLILRSKSGVSGWDDVEMETFIMEHTRIPTGSMDLPMIYFVLLAVSKDKTEFGEYAALTALDILNGKPVSEIPITVNQRAKFFLNMELAKKMGIKFPIELIERSTFVSETR